MSTAAVSGRTSDPRTGSAEPSQGVVAAVMTAVVVMWGLGPPVTKLISAPPLVGASVRFWIAAPVVVAITYATRRRLTLEVLKRTALAGLLFGTNLVALFWALPHVSIAVLSMIQALSPGVVLLAAGRWLGERATRWHVAWTGVAILGVTGVIVGGDSEVHGDTLGVVLAAATMLSFTAYYVINRRVRATTAMDPIVWMAGVTIFAGVLVTIVAVAGSSPDDYGRLGLADWLYVVFVGTVVGVLSHTLMSWAHRYIAASRSSLSVLAMNVVAVGVAWPLHDEPVTLLQVVGGVVVLGAVAAVLTRPPLPTDGTPMRSDATSFHFDDDEAPPPSAPTS